MIKKLFVLLLLSLLYPNSFGQQKIAWPEITRESKPWARWWWMGSAVNDSNLTYNMELYQKAGLGGLEITPIYGVKGYENQFINFLSPQWMGVFKHTLMEAKRLDLGIDLANGTGWPFGGPWVMQDDVSKYITYKTYTIKGGEKLPDTLKYVQKQIIRYAGSRKVPVSEISDPVATTPGLQEKALDQVRFAKPIPLVAAIAYSDKNEYLELTSLVNSSGMLNWTAPAGNWTIYALFQGPHGKLVERAAPGGEGEVIDHFSEVALKRYLNHFDGAFGGQDLSGLRGFFNDSYEVDDANGQANWTPQFFDDFYVRRGYDLRKHLPALFGKNTTEINNRVLCDYRETISDLLLQNFTTLWHQWAQKQGKIIRNQAHGSPANLLDLYSVVDIPEIEGTNSLRLKFASSASNIMGKKLTSSEAATWLNEHFQTSLGQVKIAMDRFLLAGVNHNFYHGVNYSPKNDPWPGWIFYASVEFQPTNPFWTDFAKLNRYVTRCQSFLQQGKPDNDVLLYFPIHESWSQPDRDLMRHFDGLEKGVDKSAPIIGTSEHLLKKGYAFDFISDRMLKQTKNAQNNIETPGGSYQTIVFAEPRLIPEQTLVKILNLAENGATIIFHKSLPSDVPGFNQLQSRQSFFKKLIASIHFETKDSMSIAKYGSGKILLGDNLDKLLETAKIRRETMYDSSLQCIRRKSNNGTTYFITNKGNAGVNGWFPIQSQTASVILFNPMTEQYGVAKTRANSATTEIYLQLQKDESCVVQTSTATFTDIAYPYYAAKENPITLNGKWELSFVGGGPDLASPKTLDKLISWTEIAGDTGKIFAGTACYRMYLAKPKEKAIAYKLDLGNVAASARVVLNGIPIDTLIGPAYTTIIPASAFKKTNTLEIYVSNLMANRIAHLDKQGVPWKKFYNINMSTQRAENRGTDGLFTAAGWSPKESGLLGPVTLTPLTVIKWGK